jgi:RNA polymerase sigma factor FliA
LNALAPDRVDPVSLDSAEVLARVEEGLPLVDMLARQMRRQFGPHVHVDDLASQGRETLLAAARSFDPARGVPFKRWVCLRVRGAMIDAMRQSGNLPKRVYRKLRALQAAEHVHAAAADEVTPQGAEAADAKLGDQLGTAAMAMAIGFLAMRQSDAIDAAPDPDRSPESNVGRAELLAKIRQAIAERPEQERLLLTRHYFEDVTFEETARELGLSKSWASRLHSRAIEAVARHLKRSKAY